MANIYEEIISHKLAQTIKELRGKNPTIEIVEKASNYGYVLSKIEENAVTYNILELDSRLAYSEWFSTYRFNSAGDCIIGFENTASTVDNNQEEIKYTYGAINERGCLVIEPSLDSLRFGRESTYIAGLSGKEGYIDMGTGRRITPIAFDKVYDFHNGLGKVAISTEDDICMYGYIARDKILSNISNHNGYAIPPNFVSGSDFHNGIATVKTKENEEYCIDTKGQIKILKKN